MSLGAAAGVSSSWAGQVAAKLRSAGNSRKLIVLWMPGGPSQMDTWDLKPGHANGGPFKEQSTVVPGLKFSEHLPELGKLANHLSIVRGMQTKEGDHSRGTFLVRTGQHPGAPFRYPALPASIAKELADEESGIPGYVSILPNSFINPAAFTAGFLGASREPLTVASTSTYDPAQVAEADNENNSGMPVDLRVDNLLPPDYLTKQRDLYKFIHDQKG